MTLRYENLKLEPFILRFEPVSEVKWQVALYDGGVATVAQFVGERDITHYHTVTNLGTVSFGESNVLRPSHVMVS